jgi:hypothetical protein
MTPPKRLKTIFVPFVIVVAAIYFVIDALALSVLKPFLRKIANLRLFSFVARWVASLWPLSHPRIVSYPLILLEPVKRFERIPRCVGAI